METLYHIFEVYNYKGGDLVPNTNNTYENLIDNMAEKFYNYDEVCEQVKENPKKEVVLDILRDTVEDNDFTNFYAGAEADFCGRVYKTMGDSSLLEINPFTEEWLEKYTDKILEWYEEDLD